MRCTAKTTAADDAPGRAFAAAPRAVIPGAMSDAPSEALTRLHADLVATPPLVHCVTNLVATTFSANALLALGASPAMVEDPDEAAELAAVAGAVLVNTGTMSPGRADGMHAAAEAARAAGTPWLLDPVAAGALSFRTRVAHELVGLGPAAIRGNASEVLALGGGGRGGRGVDATADVRDADDAAGTLATTGSRPVVAVSGPVDRVTDGRRQHRVGGGDPLMAQVTAMGCALGAVMAAFLAAARRTGDSDLDAVTAASAVVGAAGGAGARAADGPGSFVPAWLDALARPDLDAAAALVEAA